MANKNSTIRKRAIARAARESFRGQRRRGGKLVISQSTTRNMQMTVYRNAGGGSLTFHEVIDDRRGMRPKNHRCLESVYKGRVKAYGGNKPRTEAPAEGFEFDNSVVKV